MNDYKEILNALENIKEQLTRIERKIDGKTSPQLKDQKPKIVNDERKNYNDKIDPMKLQSLNDLKSVLDQCLHLLNFISIKTNGAGGLTTDEIRKILAEKFGKTTITINNISMSLKNATGKYVTRTKISDKTEKYQYQILTKGKEYIEAKIQKLKND